MVAPGYEPLQVDLHLDCATPPPEQDLLLQRARAPEAAREELFRRELRGRLRIEGAAAAPAGQVLALLVGRSPPWENAPNMRLLRGCPAPSRPIPVQAARLDEDGGFCIRVPETQLAFRLDLSDHTVLCLGPLDLQPGTLDPELVFGFAALGRISGRVIDFDPAAAGHVWVLAWSAHGVQELRREYLEATFGVEDHERAAEPQLDALAVELGAAAQIRGLRLPLGGGR